MCVLQGEFMDALEVLLLAQESFNMTCPELLQMIDNYGMLLIDIVW